MYEILIVLFLVVAVAIVGLVLIQKGKGSDMGSSFGAGASATLFGSAGTGNFLTKTTTVLGILFFVLSILLANIGSNKGTNKIFRDLGDGVPVAEEQVSDENDENAESTQSESSEESQEDEDATSNIPD